ncbi:MAG: hypothetical protein GXY44_15380 [Phycisphaerales bacterium]|nr:hypothetical protein [Phycisphaerales bacterium]
MPKSKRLSLLLLFAFCSVVAFSQAIEPDTPTATGPGLSTEQLQSAEPLNRQQPIDPESLAATLRTLSGRLRSEATGWRQDSAELSKRVEELRELLSKAEAERMLLNESLTKSTELQESSKKEHAQELAALQARMKAEAAAIEKERDQARRSAQLWKAAAFITAGAGAGFALGGQAGAAAGAVAGALLQVIIPAF